MELKCCLEPPSIGKKTTLSLELRSLKKALLLTTMIQDLPEEIVLKILSYLNIRELGIFPRLSKKFKLLFEKDGNYCKISILMQIRSNLEKLL
jgi:hypothetical protein